MEEMDDATDAITPVDAGDRVAGDGHSDDLALVRDLARKAYPDAVAEMIGGASVSEIVGSVDAAQAAYSRIVQKVTERSAAAVPRVPAVPAGGSSAATFDTERLPTAEKLRRGVSQARR